MKVDDECSLTCSAGGLGDLMCGSSALSWS
jgi:hypothetical protein